MRDDPKRRGGLPDDGDLLGWRTGRRRWLRLDVDVPPGQHRGKGPKNYARSDERIRDDVCERLQEADLDVGEIDVHVHDSEVTLDGVVNDRFTKRAAEDIAFTVRGVRDCHNRLRLAASSDQQRGSGVPHDVVTRVGVPRG
jgi:hypothetical protein